MTAGQPDAGPPSATDGTGAGAPVGLARPVALVTGAAQGLGRAIAVRLAADGFDVALNDRGSSAAALADAVREVQACGARSVAAAGDVSDPRSVRQVFDLTVRTFGGLNVTVSNAGVSAVQMLLEVTAEEWDATFAVNTRGMFLVYQAAARQYLRQGTGGKIIGAASLAAHRGAATVGPYSASK